MLAKRPRELRKAIKSLIPRFEEVKDEKALDDSTHSLVTFHEWRDRQPRFRFGLSAAPVASLPIAHLKLKRQGSELAADIVRVINAEKLLCKKKVPGAFNFRPFYRDTNGGSFSLRALGKDLFAYLDVLEEMENSGRPLSNADLISMMGQAILAVYDNHVRGIVHRDIKPENFLVFFHNGKCNIKLADQESVAEINSDTGRSLTSLEIFGSPMYGPPETRKIYKRMKKEGHSLELTEKYNQLNLKAFDCFTLGKTLDMMGDFLQERTPAFELLWKGLCRKNVSKRMSIEEAMNSTVFGDSPENRQAFFDELRATANDNTLTIDGYSQDAVDDVVDNPFLLLDHSIKPLGWQAVKVAEQIEECERTISDINNKSTFSDIAELVSSLKVNTSRLIETVVMDNVYNEKLAHLKLSAKRETEEVISQLFNTPDVVATLLKKAVNEACGDYFGENIGNNRGGYFEFFRGRDKKERDQVRKFKEDINSAELSPKQIFKMIYNYYNQGEGENFPGTFKNSLRNKLRKLDMKSMIEWKAHFDRLDEKSVRP